VSDTRQVVRRYFDAWTSSEGDTVAALLAPDSRVPHRDAHTSRTRPSVQLSGRPGLGPFPQTMTGRMLGLSGGSLTPSPRGPGGLGLADPAARFPACSGVVAFPELPIVADRPERIPAFPVQQEPGGSADRLSAPTSVAALSQAALGGATTDLTPRFTNTAYGRQRHGGPAHVGNAPAL
jgi:hypothetical protein